MPAGDHRPYAADPIRIVPLHRVDELAQPAHGAAAAPSPQLSYRGGYTVQLEWSNQQDACV
jgi:hypothetical protein